MIQEALKQWERTQPQNGGSCCAAGHFNNDGSTKIWTPRQDENVCVRELTWRKYVRLRDGNPNYPFARNKNDNWK